MATVPACHRLPAFCLNWLPACLSARLPACVSLCGPCACTSTPTPCPPLSKRLTLLLAIPRSQCTRCSPSCFSGVHLPTPCPTLPTNAPHAFAPPPPPPAVCLLCMWWRRGKKRQELNKAEEEKAAATLAALHLGRLTVQARSSGFACRHRHRQQAAGSRQQALPTDARL